MGRLITSTIYFEPERKVLQEALSNIDDPNKKIIVKGVIQRAEDGNFNGRKYPKPILEREVLTYQENYVNERRALGELDHSNEEVVNLKNTSHNIIEMHWEGNDLVATIEVLTTPMGNIVRNLLKDNIKLGISSRGVGSVKKDREGYDVVQEDFSILAWDFVSTPSTKGAFVFPVGKQPLAEGKITGTQNPETNKWESVEGIIRDILIESR